MKIYKVAITGVESTGKSTLADFLAMMYQSQCLAEYARIYLSKLNAPYGRMDVLQIGQQQIMRQRTMEALIKTLEKAGKELNRHIPFFYDTELTVIKIWYENRYQKPLPDYLNKAYQEQQFDLYLLPYPDLVWEYDPLREHQDMETRLQLFEQYEQAMKQMGRRYEIIRGEGKKRVELAKSIVADFLAEKEREYVQDAEPKIPAMFEALRKGLNAIGAK
jgi:nicotinamide riboside kinase